VILNSAVQYETGAYTGTENSNVAKAPSITEEVLEKLIYKE
jgi:hypothetical protein